MMGRFQSVKLKYFYIKQDILGSLTIEKYCNMIQWHVSFQNVNFGRFKLQADTMVLTKTKNG